MEEQKQDLLTRLDVDVLSTVKSLEQQLVEEAGARNEGDNILREQLARPIIRLQGDVAALLKPGSHRRVVPHSDDIFERGRASLYGRSKSRLSRNLMPLTASSLLRKQNEQKRYLQQSSALTAAVASPSSPSA